MLNKVLNKNTQAVVKKACEPINSLNAYVDTMVLKKGDEFFGFQPTESKSKKADHIKVADVRLKQLYDAFRETERQLNEAGITLLICFIGLNEGGAVIYASDDAVKMKMDVMQELKNMERKHKKGASNA